ncbi:hypothetical protein KsCSTR_46630 [Candidatus Kuenenia stuttgartiensis]|uniref:Uncharacterized protein n=1 Tax=Kuenenia stuttgartiensis TaxID=174633 RepID=Q1PW74_KUEST|nr:hypothetical protein KsCSTR_46630 [Candidatus Kuenenia stuttgartiensis]CAJ71473.1 unknown protein [Candidatus Kuenenia stuttgartiensis]
MYLTNYSLNYTVKRSNKLQMLQEILEVSPNSKEAVFVCISMNLSTLVNIPCWFTKCEM